MDPHITSISRQDYFPTMIFSATAGDDAARINADLLTANHQPA